jgi:hypothetical protein
MGLLYICFALHTGRHIFLEMVVECKAHEREERGESMHVCTHIQIYTQTLEHLSSSSLSLENPYGLIEKVGTIGLQSFKRNRCGTAMKRAKEVMLSEAHTGVSGNGQTQPSQSSQPQNLKPSSR